MIRPSHILRQFGALLGAALLWLCVGIVAAHAHAEYRGSTPEADALLQAMPPEVVLRFSEPVGVLTVHWLTPDGASLPAEAVGDGEGLRITTPSAGPTGTYALSWRVASTDGHPVSGGLVFSVGEITGAPQVAQGGPAVSPVVLRAVMVLALVVSVGTAVFGWLIAPVDTVSRRIAIGAALLVLPAGLLLMGAEGADRMGLSPLQLLSWAALSAGFAAPVMPTVVLSALAAFVAMSGRRWAAPVAWPLAALSFAVSGHARSAPGHLAPFLTVLHSGAMLFWAGSLLPLARQMMLGTARLRILRRFSQFALPIVLVLIASGTGLIWIRTGIPGLFGSDWMRLLAVKLALVSAMLALALWHRFVSTPRLAAGEGAGLSRSISLEAVLGFAVIVLAMGFRFAPPPAAALPEPAEIIHMHRDRAMALLTPSGAPPGPITFEVTTMDGDMATLDPKELTMTLTDQQRGIGPLSVPMQHLGPGEWSAGPSTLPTPGPWTIHLTLLISDFEQISLTGDWQTTTTGETK